MWYSSASTTNDFVTMWYSTGGSYYEFGNMFEISTIEFEEPEIKSEEIMNLLEVEK